MKTSILSILFIAFFHLSSAQVINIPSTLNVSEGSAELDNTTRNGFSVELAGDEKEIILAFEDYLENQSKKYKVKSLFKKISAEDILVPEFSDKHFNLYAQVRETESTISLWYWVSFGTDIYVNSTDYPQEAQKCKTLLKDFSREYFSSFVRTDMTSINETMEKTNEDLEAIIHDISDLTKEKRKEEKDKEKIRSKKQKLETKLSELQIEISEKETEIQQIDAEVELLSTKIKAKEESQHEIEAQIVSQEKTLQELKTKLAMIEQL